MLPCPFPIPIMKLSLFPARALIHASLFCAAEQSQEI